MAKVKKLIIIGAGMGGLAAGVYGRLNGYDTEIFEQHTICGGQCTSYKRKGYVFDVCIHHLFGCAEGSFLNTIWRELGAMPTRNLQPEDCESFLFPDGRMFKDYYDTTRLEDHLLSLSPADARAIKEYVAAIRRLSRLDLFGELIASGPAVMLKRLPTLLPLFKYFPMTTDKFAARFKDPWVRKSFELAVYSLPKMPMIMHLARKAGGVRGDVGWPEGGAGPFSRAIEKRYKSLGGVVHYAQKVAKILTRDDKAVGIRLADGTEVGGDIVISDADGRKTLFEMLDGKFMDKQLQRECEPPPDDTNWGLHVFFGVNRDLSKEPSDLVMLLDQPVLVSDRTVSSIEMQCFGHDPSMAPEGKGVIKVELFSKYSYWKSLSADRAAYKEEKQRVVEQVLGILEIHFNNIREQVETVDVPTLMTWERYMGGTHGFANLPNRKMSITGAMSVKGMRTTIARLKNFYFTGVWATMAGALFMNAISGKKVIEQICAADGRKFHAIE